MELGHHIPQRRLAQLFDADIFDRCRQLLQVAFETVRIDAAQFRSAPFQQRTATGAMGRNIAVTPFAGRGADDIGNDVAGPFDDDLVVDLDIVIENILYIVQCGALNGHAADFHRIDFRHRRQIVLAETPFDGADDAFAPDAAEFEGDLAARMVRGVAQRVAVFLIGQFDDDAVHRVGQGLDFGQQLRPAVGQFGKGHRITD